VSFRAAAAGAACQQPLALVALDHQNVDSATTMDEGRDRE
jgi:hypothetical protein